MTVAELIVNLQRLDPSALVLLDGYEGGQDVLLGTLPCVARITREPNGYVGPWDAERDEALLRLSTEDYYDNHGPITQAVLLTKRETL